MQVLIAVVRGFCCFCDKGLSMPRESLDRALQIC